MRSLLLSLLLLVNLLSSQNALAADECTPANCFDVAVVGAGPAGLQATLTLARSTWRVVNVDDDSARNKHVAHFHNFFSHDGDSPREVKRRVREKIDAYGSVTWVGDTVVDVRGTKGNFSVETKKGQVYRVDRVVLATGVTDEAPAGLPGYEVVGNTHVFGCPFCDGWENRGKRWAMMLSSYPPPMHDAVFMFAAFDKNMVVLTNGSAVDPGVMSRMKKANLRVEEGRIKGLRVKDGELVGADLEGGAHVDCEVLFYKPHALLPPLVQRLQLKTSPAGLVNVGMPSPETSTPGIWAAGDLSQTFQSWANAVASGGMTAGMLHFELSMAKALGLDEQALQQQQQQQQGGAAAAAKAA